MTPPLPLIDRIRSARQSLAEGGPASVRSTGDFERVSVPHSDADALRDWLLADQAQVVIEIGLAYGASALAIAEALVTNGAGNGSHLIIDPFQNQFDDAGWDLVVSAGLSDLCSLDRERSQFVLARLAAGGFVADAAFVDGSHVFHNVFVDLVFIDELVRSGGLVVVDDCSWPSVATAVRYFEVNAGWRLEPTGRETRLRSYRLPRLRVEHRFQDFQPFGID